MNFCFLKVHVNVAHSARTIEWDFSMIFKYVLWLYHLIFFKGDILQEAVRQLQPGVKVGKILIQRDESSESKTPVLYYKKLPKDIADCFVILVDPMLATAG